MHILQALNYQIKNYDKAIEFGNRAVKAGTASEEDKRTIVGQSYYLKGDWKGTLTTENALVDQEIKAGQIPKDQQLGLILNSACIKLDDATCQQHALERLVTYYPKPDYWLFLLQRVQSSSSSRNDTDTLFQTYRLMLDTDTLKNPGDFNEAAQLAVDRPGLPRGSAEDSGKGPRRQRVRRSAHQGPQHAPPGNGEEDLRDGPGLAGQGREGR